MKKILSLVVVSFLWCNVSFSEINYTCFQTSYPDFKKSDSIKFGQLQFSISSNGSIYTQVDNKIYRVEDKSEEAMEIWSGLATLIKKSSKTNLEVTDEEKKSLNPFINEKITFKPHTKKFWDVRHSAGGVIQTVKELKTDISGDTFEFWNFDLNKLEATYNIAWTPEFVRNWNKNMTSEHLKKFNRINERPFLVNKYQNCLVVEENGTDQAGSSGTALFIKKKGYLLTNNHVVEGCSLSKISYKNNDYDTKLIATDRTLDLALLKSELKPKTFINFSDNDVKKLDTIYVAGYPLGIEGLSDDLKMNPGVVSSLKGFDNNSNEIQIDAAINSGNSGGPIINENGDLVAITVSGMAKDQTEGINFGIKSSAAERFLKSNNINFNKSLNSRSKNKEQLRNILEEGTVYTYCN